MRYLCLLYVNEDTIPGSGTPEFAEVAQANIAAAKEAAFATLPDEQPRQTDRTGR